MEFVLKIFSTFDRNCIIRPNARKEKRSWLGFWKICKNNGSLATALRKIEIFPKFY